MAAATDPNSAGPDTLITDPALLEHWSRAAAELAGTGMPGTGAATGSRQRLRSELEKAVSQTMPDLPASPRLAILTAHPRVV